MPTKVRIGNRWIGDGEPCFIIAEAGSNHNGTIERARQLVDVAASAGADAVKFQLFRAAKLYAKNAGESKYLEMEKPIYDVIADLEMPYEWLAQLSERCRERGILLLASAFDEDSADELDKYVEAFKVASYEVTHLPLIQHLARKGKPVIISTGTANLEEVKMTVDEFRRAGNEGLILMQCTAAYPAPVESLNIKAVETMKSAFGVPVGLSDHSRDPLVGALVAVGVGANLIEKHFTLSNRLPGPDHKYALEPAELSIMIRRVREAEKALGSGEKTMQPVEAELKRFARRYVYAVRDIASGEKFTRVNIAVLRSGNLEPGLDPIEYPKLLGQRAAKHIRAESPLTSADILIGNPVENPTSN